jgi:hypothetical protein
MLGRPTYTQIGEAKIMYNSRIEKITPVDDDGVTETVAQPLEVQSGKFSPICEDHQSIGAFSGRVRIVDADYCALAILYSAFIQS